MSEEKNIATEKVEANWDALMSDPVMGDPNFKPKETENKEDAINKDLIDPINDNIEVKNPVEEKPKEEPKTETKTESVEEKPEETTVDTVEDQGIFKVEEIEGVPAVYPENSLRAIAQKLGAEIKDESIDAFKEAFIPKSEVDKIVPANKEELFAKLKPEVAAALELMELGVPEHLITEPTKELDSYIAMDDAELVRAELSTLPGWTEEMINTEIESLSENGKLEHNAAKIRIGLENDKKAILSQRTDIIKQLTEKQQQASEQKMQLERTQTIEELNKVSELMGVKIPAKVKEALIAKYKNGLYDKELSSPRSNAEYIIKKELEAQVAKRIQITESEKVKKAATDKLLNIPPVKSGGGGKSIVNEPIDNWSALDKDFS